MTQENIQIEDDFQDSSLHKHKGASTTVNEINNSRREILDGKGKSKGGIQWSVLKAV